MEIKTYEELEKMVNEIKNGEYNAEQIGDVLLCIIRKMKSVHERAIGLNPSGEMLTERMIKKNFIIDEVKIRSELK
ncbi:MAG: hypothetical protein LBL33_10780 [Tannerella sp.]|jgi:hypothetical protein|nr:hypothetical protein [Tannerella sp.]